MFGSAYAIHLSLFKTLSFSLRLKKTHHVQKRLDWTTPSSQYLVTLPRSRILELLNLLFNSGKHGLLLFVISSYKLLYQFVQVFHYTSLYRNIKCEHNV